MSIFHRGTYTGYVIAFKGKKAELIFDLSKHPAGKILVQFDDTELVHPGTNTKLGYGWHLFDMKDFALDQEPSGEQDESETV